MNTPHQNLPPLLPIYYLSFSLVHLVYPFPPTVFGSVCTSFSLPCVHTASFCHGASGLLPYCPHAFPVSFIFQFCGGPGHLPYLGVILIAVCQSSIPSFLWVGDACILPHCSSWLWTPEIRPSFGYFCMSTAFIFTSVWLMYASFSPYGILGPPPLDMMIIHLVISSCFI